MPLKPSRRLPKAFQRSVSPLSRRIAQKSFRRKKGGIGFRFVLLIRQWRRFLRSVQASLSYLKLWCYLSTGIFFLLVILYFLFSPSFAVTSMQVGREDRRTDVEEIQKLLSPFFGKHILFVSPVLLERTLLAAYPEISSVRVRRNFPNELQVELFMDPIVANVTLGEPGDTERDFANQIALESSEESSSSAEGKRYRYLTEQGIYLEYPFSLQQKEQEERLSLYVVDWAVKPTHRERLLAPEVYYEIRSVKRILEETFGHTVGFTTMYLRAKEFHVQTERLTLWFDLASPLAAQIDRYRKFLRTVSPENAQEYVDLRLHDRVVYR